MTRGSTSSDSFLATQGIYTALSAGDLAQAERELAVMRALVDPRRLLDVSHCGALTSAVAVLAGRVPEALEIIAREVAMVESLGASFPTAAFRIQYAQTLVLAGRQAEAYAPAEAALAFARRMPSRIQEFQALLTLAWACSRSGAPEQALEHLRRGLAIGRSQDYLNCHPLWIAQMLREILSQAVAAGIEPAYVRRFIRQRRLTPPADVSAAWPWPLRLRTLGGFAVEQDGQPTSSGRKSQQKVLDLLKALVANGPRGVSADTLAALLWPESEGDAGRDALRVASSAAQAPG